MICQMAFVFFWLLLLSLRNLVVQVQMKRCRNINWDGILQILTSIMLMRQCLFIRPSFIVCFFSLKDDNQTGISSLGFVSQLPGVFILYLIRYKIAKMQTLGWKSSVHPGWEAVSQGCTSKFRIRLHGYCQLPKSWRNPKHLEISLGERFWGSRGDVAFYHVM